MARSGGAPLRSEYVGVRLTRDTAAELKVFADDNHWTLSTAVNVLIERGLRAARAEAERPRLLAG